MTVSVLIVMGNSTWRDVCLEATVEDWQWLRGCHVLQYIGRYLFTNQTKCDAIWLLPNVDCGFPSLVWLHQFWQISSILL